MLKRIRIGRYSSPGEKANRFAEKISFTPRKEEEPVVTYAAAATDPYIAQGSLSTTEDHYGTCSNLCSTRRNT